MGYGMLPAQQYVQYGEAAYYADRLHGNTTSSGEIYDRNKLTAAHKTLPTGSIVEVTRIDNGRRVRVRINDCGPHTKGRIIDLSRTAAEQLDLIRAGVADVRLELISLGAGDPPCGGTPQLESYNNRSDQSTTLMTARGLPDRQSPAPQNTRAMPQPTPTNGTYPVSAFKPVSSGFGVQVGAFITLKNAMDKVEQLEKKFFENILLNVREGNANRYKVILGPFETKQQAQAYSRSLAQKHQMEGFVINLADNN